MRSEYQPNTPNEPPTVDPKYRIESVGISSPYSAKTEGKDGNNG